MPHAHHLTNEYKRRIGIIKGQLNGLQKMIDADQYCVDILNQSLAIQNSLKSLDSIIYENHIRKHALDQIKVGDEQGIAELVRLFKRVNG